MMAAGDSDFLKTFPLCYSISEMLKVSCAFSAKQSCKKFQGLVCLVSTIQKVQGTANATALKSCSCSSMSHPTNCLERDLEM